MQIFISNLCYSKVQAKRLILLIDALDSFIRPEINAISAIKYKSRYIKQSLFDISAY